MLCLLKHKNIWVWIYLEGRKILILWLYGVFLFFLTISSFNHKCASKYFRFFITPTGLRQYIVYKMWKCMQTVNWKNLNFDLRWNKNLLLIVADPYTKSNVMRFSAKNPSYVSAQDCVKVSPWSAAVFQITSNKWSVNRIAENFPFFLQIRESVNTFRPSICLSYEPCV